MSSSCWAPRPQVAFPFAAQRAAANPALGFLNWTVGCTVNHRAGFSREGLNETGLCRGPKRYDRISLGRGAVSIDSRPWPPNWFGVRWPCLSRRSARRIGGEGGDHGTSLLCSHIGDDPVATRSGRELESARRQYHRRVATLNRSWRRNGWSCCTRLCRSRQSLGIARQSGQAASADRVNRDMRKAARRRST